MPSISYFTSSISRQGVSKTFSHGSLQSVVAATHPASFPNQHRSHFAGRRPSRSGGKFTNNYQFKNAFHNSSALSSAPNDVRDARHEKAVSSHGELDAYFEARSQKQDDAIAEPEEEWEQSQFAKRIEWKKPAPAVEELRREENIALTVATRASLDRSYSTSAVDDLKAAEDKVLQDEQLGLEDAEPFGTELDALAEIDAKLQKEANLRAALEELDVRVPTPPVAPFQSPALTVRSFTEESVATRASSMSPVSEAQAHKFAAHMTQLADEGRYAEIPAVFQAMLVGDVTPTAQAYSALLLAVINFTGESMQSVPKALDLYSDMLRRKVAPNTEIYSTMLSLVTARSLQISTEKKLMESRRLRYGGMKEADKFMFASTELEFEILSEDDRLPFAIDLFKKAITGSKRVFSSETYHNMIVACAESSRVSDMYRLYEHMESNNVTPWSATFSALINGFASARDLSSAVERYNEYKDLAIAHDNGDAEIESRHDATVYASLVRAYVRSDKLTGAEKFLSRIAASTDSPETRDTVILHGLVQGLLDVDSYSEALSWVAQIHDSSAKHMALDTVAVKSADHGNIDVAMHAFNSIPLDYEFIAHPAMAMLALSIRNGDVVSAPHFWNILSAHSAAVTAAFIEPTAMYAVALIGKGRVAEGLLEAEQMLGRIRASAPDSIDVADQIEEATHFVQSFMSEHGIVDPRPMEHQAAPDPAQEAALAARLAYENTFDPYASSTDAKGSALIVDELERGSNGRGKDSKVSEAMSRLRNMRRIGRHPRYITYAKLISAAACENRFNLVNEIHAMVQADMPLLPEFALVRYGWASILDAMVGACLTIGKRDLASKYHQELLDMGCAPTANTFGLYITTLKDSTKTFDEASEAVQIFHRAQAEGVEPSSFLYNALIGKLGKARRIDDCLYYFNEMRTHHVRPTSVTYGTIVNALCRVSDAKFAEELFEEMESMPNYKARTAPYNSMMQFFLNTKRDKAKVLAYYERMKARNIPATNHTFKLLVDAHATLEPVNMPAAESILDLIRASGQKPEAVHYSSLIHAHGCVLHDLAAARFVFDSVLADASIRPQACLYQALFESMVANHEVAQTLPLIADMYSKRVEMTPYIANTLIKGWAAQSDLSKAEEVFRSLGLAKREPSTYEAMTRAYLGAGETVKARAVVSEMCSRGYPAAVANKVFELIGGAEA